MKEKAIVTLWMTLSHGPQGGSWRINAQNKSTCGCLMFSPYFIVLILLFFFFFSYLLELLNVTNFFRGLGPEDALWTMPRHLERAGVTDTHPRSFVTVHWARSSPPLGINTVWFDIFMSVSVIFFKGCIMKRQQPFYPGEGIKRLWGPVRPQRTSPLLFRSEQQKDAVSTQCGLT